MLNQHILIVTLCFFNHYFDEHVKPKSKIDNERTNTYLIFDEYLMTNSNKFGKFLEMCEDANKSDFFRYQIIDWITNNDLLYTNNEKNYIQK